MVLPSLLGRYLHDPDQVKRNVFKEVGRRLISRDAKEAWMSGQRMTERKGRKRHQWDGDSHCSLSANLVRQISHAIRPLQHQRLQTVLQRHRQRLRGPACKDAFRARRLCLFASTNAVDGTLNGVHIQRLKNKMGTRRLAVDVQDEGLHIVCKARVRPRWRSWPSSGYVGGRVWVQLDRCLEVLVHLLPAVAADCTY